MSVGVQHPRNVVVFAATGAIASAVAREFAKEGANLFLSSRAADPPAEWDRDRVDWARVDATRAEDVEAYYQDLRRRRVAPDVIFNGIGVRAGEGGFGTPSHLLSSASFQRALSDVVGSQFLTASRGTALMAEQGRGVVILLTSSLAKAAIPYMSGITAASDAVEGLTRVLQAEHRSTGVRVVCACVAGMPETRMIQETMAANARTRGVSVEDYAKNLPAAQAGAASLSLNAAAAAIALLASEAAAPLANEPVNIGFL
jgi:NAD(P)-dependent dehydrogenase (short-subunit alcohol dehydrogenase family)